MRNKYQIIKTKDPTIIKHLLPYIEKTIKKTKDVYSLESFIKWLRMGIGNPVVGTWIVIRNGNRLVKNDRKIVGYAIGNIAATLDKEYFNLVHLYSEDKSLTDKLCGTVEKWAKDYGLHEIQTTTKRNPKALNKRFGFKLASYNLLKEI